MVTAVEHDPAEAADDRAGFDKWSTLLRNIAGWMRSHPGLIEISYVIPERSGYGWYVVAKNPVFDFELNKQLAEFGATLIQKGFAIHAALIPGSVPPTVPTDGIAISPSGQVATYAD